MDIRYYEELQKRIKELASLMELTGIDSVNITKDNFSFGDASIYDAAVSLKEESFDHKYLVESSMEQSNQIKDECGDNEVELTESSVQDVDTNSQGIENDSESNNAIDNDLCNNEQSDRNEESTESNNTNSSIISKTKSIEKVNADEPTKRKPAPKAIDIFNKFNPN